MISAIFHNTPERSPGVAFATCGNTLLCPVLGQTYNYFDDGKISPSRRMEVVITEIIPFNEIDAETLEYWKEEVEECNWLTQKKLITL